MWTRSSRMISIKETAVVGHFPVCSARVTDGRSTMSSQCLPQPLISRQRMGARAAACRQKKSCHVRICAKRQQLMLLGSSCRHTAIKALAAGYDTDAETSTHSLLRALKINARQTKIRACRAARELQSGVHRCLSERSL